MTLTAQTKIGLTIGQIIGGTVLIFSIIIPAASAWKGLNERVTILEQNKSSQEIMLKQLREENREDHKTIQMEIQEILKLQIKDHK